MYDKKVIFPITIIVFIIVCGSIIYFYNSKITDIQLVIDEQQTEILTLQNQINNLETQLQANFFIQSYIAWMAIPRNESPHYTPNSPIIIWARSQLHIKYKKRN